MLVRRVGRPPRAFRPASEWDLLVREFDDGADEAIALLRHEVLTLGAIPLHPDGDRITTHDPVPLVCDNERSREAPKPKPVPRPLRPLRPRRPPRSPWRPMWRWPDCIFVPDEPPPPWTPPPPPELEPLPLTFRWRLKDGIWITQADVEEYWERRLQRKNTRVLDWSIT